MNAHRSEWASLQDNRRFLFFTQDGAAAQSLSRILANDGLLIQEEADSRPVARLAEVGAGVVFLDFGPGVIAAGGLAHATELARMLARADAKVPVVAVGSLLHPEGAVAALRAGVSDFVDLADEQEVQRVMARVLTSPDGTFSRPGRGRLIVLLGVRAGVGTSTLSVHLASLMQQRASRGGGADGERAAVDGAVLLDLGWPVADGQLYLNASGSFHFAEAARNLRRFDDTLVNTAMTRSPCGVTVLPLPHDLAEMRTVSHADCLGLLEKLRAHFGVLLADLGGFSNADFVAEITRAADQAWLVTDQSVGAIVSLAETLRELDEHGVDRSRVRLVVNRYDERYGMAAEQIAERFKVKLLATLPDRALSLMTCTNQGHLLHEIAERDPYVKTVQGLAEQIGDGYVRDKAAAMPVAWLSKWLPAVHR